MSKHSSGPWAVDCVNRSLVWQDFDNEDGSRTYIADCDAFNEDMPQEEYEANAALIAAAPDLYEALERIACELKSEPNFKDPMIRRIALTALAKAQEKQ